jgi:hypothetical protein
MHMDYVEHAYSVVVVHAAADMDLSYEAAAAVVAAVVQEHSDKKDGADATLDIAGTVVQVVMEVVVQNCSDTAWMVSLDMACCYSKEI